MHSWRRRTWQWTQVWWSRDENHHSQPLPLSCDKGSHRHPCSAHKIPGKGMDIFLYREFFILLHRQRGANMLFISYIKIAPVSFKVSVTPQRNYKSLLQSLGEEEEISRKNFCPLFTLNSIPEWRFFSPRLWARLLHFCLFVCSETGSHHVALAVLELTMYTGLDLNSWRAACLWLLNFYVLCSAYST